MGFKLAVHRVPGASERRRVWLGVGRAHQRREANEVHEGVDGGVRGRRGGGMDRGVDGFDHRKQGGFPGVGDELDVRARRERRVGRHAAAGMSLCGGDIHGHVAVPCGKAADAPRHGRRGGRCGVGRTEKGKSSLKRSVGLTK